MTLTAYCVICGPRNDELRRFITLHAYNKLIEINQLKLQNATGVVTVDVAAAVL